MILSWHLHSETEVPILAMLFKTTLKYFQGNLTTNMCFTTLPSRERILILFTVNHYFCKFHLLNALYLFSKGWDASH